MARPEPKKRLNATDQMDREIAREESMFAGVTQLPRRARVNGHLLEPDAHFGSVSAHWPATFIGYSFGRWGWADFRLPLGWHVAPVVAGHAELRDDKERSRALLIERTLHEDAVIVLLERVHTTLEADDEDGIRVATIDRATGRRMRVSPWLDASDHVAIARYRVEQSDWLLEIRPRHLDPFAYW